ncbi:hypothetical protein GQ53DRAFT_854040 [Thozetella sp. PMI_491]|nr:hypothetical protein GQ53DRAFT_854040 [Thozetella sp. PMI_491]
MDARTPLLHDRQGLPVPIGSATVQDHPIFLRACHSPWSLINQSALTYIRAFIVAYLTAVGGMLIDFKLQRDDPHTNWRILWQFSSMSFLLMWLYHVTVFCWTFTHLYYPDIAADDRRWESILLRGMAPPVQTTHSRKRFYFSLFYTAVHVFTFMNTIIYWTVLVPQDHGHLPQSGSPSGHPVHDFFGDGWFKPFCIINQWGITTLIAMIEILGLNSIKRQVPVPSHIFGLMFLCAAYLGWAAFGKILTGHNAFFWMDPELVKYREVVAAYSAAFVSLGSGMFSFMYGLIGMRENLTKKESNGGPSGSGYTNRVPQAVPV